MKVIVVETKLKRKQALLFPFVSNVFSNSKMIVNKNRCITQRLVIVNNYFLSLLTIIFNFEKTFETNGKSNACFLFSFVSTTITFISTTI